MLDSTKKWQLQGRVNAIFARAEKMAPPPQEMLASEAMILLRKEGLTFSDCGEVMRSSKYAAHARLTGYPLCALPLGRIGADPAPPKKPSFWKPVL